MSTVKDTAQNVETFVRRNLAAGVDHMFVFLDGPDPETRAWLDRNEHATAIRAGQGYWAGRRPGDLNVRQAINANLVNCLLAPFDRVRWLFHIDGDECLDVDRSILLGLDDSCPSVRLQCWEAVSQQHWDGEVTHFKKELPNDELSLLSTLGIIRRPTNRSYFNGHLGGKSGSRPSLDIRVRLHWAEDPDGARIEGFTAPDLHLLHYDSISGEEFVRKWSTHLSATTLPRFSGPRDRVRGALQAIMRNDALSAARKEDLLMEVYRHRVQDDFVALRELGYLVSPDPEHHSYQPANFTKKELGLLPVYLDHLLRADKQNFRPRPVGTSPRPLVQEINERVRTSDPDLSRLLARCLAK